MAIKEELKYRITMPMWESGYRDDWCWTMFGFKDEFEGHSGVWNSFHIACKEEEHRTVIKVIHCFKNESNYTEFCLRWL